jgi:hypothetical protein
MNNFAVDNIGNMYLIHGEELVKYLPSGKMFARYSNLKFGNIASLDPTNPLKILLYYRDFQQIVYLDNQLSVNSDPISLEKLGIEQTELACASVNNSFWIYNKQNNELLRFNENSIKVASTGNLKQILREDLQPDFMVEHNNMLFLNCKDKGIYVFDMFGAFSKVIGIRNLKEFQALENRLIYHRDSMLCAYDHKLLDEQCRKGDWISGMKNVKVLKDKVYIGYADSLVVLALQ